SHNAEVIIVPNSKKFIPHGEWWQQDAIPKQKRGKDPPLQQRCHQDLEHQPHILCDALSKVLSDHSSGITDH
ncbi:hypothetical protein PIB30_092082, partial [Stylosanthes scabra]|nr:hypothetical protein [Stylosanthes scabra]